MWTIMTLKDLKDSNVRRITTLRDSNLNVCPLKFIYLQMSLNFIIKELIYSIFDIKKMINLLDLIKKQKEINSRQLINASDVKGAEQTKKQGVKSQPTEQKIGTPSLAFKNSSMMKQQSLISNFYQVITGAQRKVVPQVKVTPTLLINKIQQSRPQFKSGKVCKQMSFDILLEQEDSKTDKVKNCVGPSRPNSQIYKRLSKNFFYNLKNGVDQCILFTGLQSHARVQSSIGNQNNPGVFMIAAIAILDEKYKEKQESFDVQFSFLECKGQRMYDLLNHTRIPLEHKGKQNASQSTLQFCEHRVKVCTFIQFIKLFKVALFNNKERDFRTDKNYPKTQNDAQNMPNSQLTSTFIMKIRIKKYNMEEDLFYEQQSMLVDLDQRCFSRNIHSKDQQNHLSKVGSSGQRKRKTTQPGTRTLMDYVLIEINNSNPANKPLNYHMVEKNLMLQILKKYLKKKEPNNQLRTKVNNKKNSYPQLLTKQQPRTNYVGGQLFIVNSFTTNASKYSQNLKLYENLVSALGTQWWASVKNKEKYNKLFDLSFSERVLQKVLTSLKNRQLGSLRDLYVFKQFYIKESRKLLWDIKQNRNVILQYLKGKRGMKYSENVLTAYQVQLIGNCIKSDNFKDFYTSKSFLALPRQIEIKTQKIKAQIAIHIQGIRQTERKFYALKKNENQDRKSSIAPSTLLTINSEKYNQTSKSPFKVTDPKNKFKLLQTPDDSLHFQQPDQLQGFISLRKYTYDYLQDVWNRVYLTQQRTITEQIQFGDVFSQEIAALRDRLYLFISQLESIQQSVINNLKDDNPLSSDNFTQLIRSINQAKKSVLKYQPKHTGSSTFAFKKASLTKNKQGNFSTISHLPRIQQAKQNLIQTLANKKQKVISIKRSHDKNQRRKNQIFQIKGKIDFESLLLQPNKLI